MFSCKVLIRLYLSPISTFYFKNIKRKMPESFIFQTSGRDELYFKKGLRYIGHFRVFGLKSTYYGQHCSVKLKNDQFSKGCISAPFWVTTLFKGKVFDYLLRVQWNPIFAPSIIARFHICPPFSCPPTLSDLLIKLFLRRSKWYLFSS